MMNTILKDEYTTELWDYLEEMEIATKDELRLVTCINGCNPGTLESVLYVRTGYRSLQQLKECEGEQWK